MMLEPFFSSRSPFFFAPKLLFFPAKILLGNFWLIFTFLGGPSAFSFDLCLLLGLFASLPGEHLG